MIEEEKSRRWQLILGSSDDEHIPKLSQRDAKLAALLEGVYGSKLIGNNHGGQRGSLNRSAPKVAKWIGDVRQYFPSSIVQVIQKDAFERLGLKQMLLEPEFLAAMQADVHLVADLISLRHVMPDKTIETARLVVKKVVDELRSKLQLRMENAIRGAINKGRRTFHPRFSDIEWNRTIQANLRHYQADYQTIIPEKLIGFLRHQRRATDLDEVILCVDQSGSMGTSVVYSSIFAAVIASIPSVATKLICFDTAILDLTEELEDPVQVLFGVQLGGGTDINQAIAYCENKIERPSKTHLILISDLYEGGNTQEFLARTARLIRQGVNIVCLLALNDDGRPCYDENIAQVMAGMGLPVFACTPDQFPDMMATALKRENIHDWATNCNIKFIHGEERNPLLSI